MYSSDSCEKIIKNNNYLNGENNLKPKIARTMVRKPLDLHDLLNLLY